MSTTQQMGSNSTRQPVKILVIQPDDRAPLGRFSDWLADYGAEVTLLQPFAGDQIPADVAADGLIVLGGTMHFDDAEHFPWLADIHALYRQAAAANIPTLGICLGAQLLADSFGGKVTVKSPTGPETGVVEITQTEEGAHDPIMEGLPDSFRATAFHYDGITELPAGLSCLVRENDIRTRFSDTVMRLACSFTPKPHRNCFRTGVREIARASRN